MNALQFRNLVQDRMSDINLVRRSIVENMTRDYFGEIEWHRVTGKSIDRTANLVFIKAYNNTPPIDFDVFDEFQEV